MCAVKIQEHVSKFKLNTVTFLRVCVYSTAGCVFAHALPYVLYRKYCTIIIRYDGALR